MFKGLKKLQVFLVQGFEKTARVFGSRVRKKRQGFFVQRFEKNARVFWFKGLKKLQGFLVQITSFFGSRMCFDKKFKSFW